MAVTFALASYRSSKVRFFDASGHWTAEVKQFPRGIGKLVESAGELLFFVRVTYNTSLDPPVACSQVTTWNPFTNDIDTLPRPPLTNSLVTRCFPHLVSVQLFDREYAPTFVPIAHNPKLVRYINRLNLAPPEGYMLTMVSLNDENEYAMGHYYSSKRSWIPANCDGYVVQDMADTGLHPPGSIVFRDTRTGSLVKFDAPGAFSEPIPNPHALDPFDKLDDPHTCVFVMPAPGGLQSIYEKAPHVIQVEQAFINRNAPATVRLFRSPAINLHNIVSGVHVTFLLGAKTGAIVVQLEPVPDDWDHSFQAKIYLHMFGTRQWKVVQGTDKIDFESDDFKMGRLCQRTSTHALKSEVPKPVNSWMYMPKTRKWEQVKYTGASASDKNLDIATKSLGKITSTHALKREVPKTGKSWEYMPKTRKWEHVKDTGATSSDKNLSDIATTLEKVHI